MKETRYCPISDAFDDDIKCIKKKCEWYLKDCPAIPCNLPDKEGK